MRRLLLLGLCISFALGLSGCDEGEYLRADLRAGRTVGDPGSQRDSDAQPDNPYEKRATEELLREQRDAERHERLELEKRYADLKDGFADLESENQSLERELSWYRRNGLDREKVERLTALATESEQKLRVLRRRMEDLAAERDRLVNEKAELYEKLVHTEQQLDQASKAIAALKEECDALRREIAQEREESKRLREETRLARDALRAATKQVERVRKLEQENTSLRAQQRRTSRFFQQQTVIQRRLSATERNYAQESLGVLGVPFDAVGNLLVGTQEMIEGKKIGDWVFVVRDAAGNEHRVSRHTAHELIEYGSPLVIEGD